jgi:hypothetical protein
MMKSLLLALALVGSVLAQRKPSVGSILKIRLIDADMNQPIAGYDPLPTTTASIDASALPTTNLAVEAITNGTFASVVWNINTTATGPASKVVNSSPVWVPCGKNGTDIFKCNSIQVGKPVTFQATPYSGKSGTGTVGGSVSVSILLYHSNILTFTLVNADSDTDIGPLLNDTAVVLKDTPRINVRANIKSGVTVGSVKFTNEKGLSKIDSKAPFAYYNNNGADYLPWAPKVGRRSLTVSAYSGTNGQGSLLSTDTVSLVVDTKDRTKPKLHSFLVLTPIVNVTSTNAGIAEFQLVVHDDYSGIAMIAVGVSGLGPYVEVDPTIGGNQAIKWNISLDIPADSFPGRFPLYVSVRDFESNNLYLSEKELGAMGLPTHIVVNNPDADISPPELLSFTALSPLTVDVTTSGATVQFKIVAQDDKGVVSCGIFARGNGQFFEAQGSMSDPVAGKTECLLHVYFHSLTPPGTYFLEVRLFDAKVRWNILGAAALAQLSFPSTVEVINSGADTFAPTLLTFSATPSPWGVYITYNVEDLQSGFWFGRVWATLPDGTRRGLDSSEMMFCAVPQFYFEGWLDLPTRGAYKLSIELEDGIGNAATISSEELTARGFLGSFTN